MRRLLIDAALSVAAGFVAGRVMDAVTTRIYESQSQRSKDQEQAASDTPAFEGMVKTLTDRAGLHLSDGQAKTGGEIVHQTLGIAAAPLYITLRDLTRMSSLDAGLLTGAVLYIGLDEVLNPALGVTPGFRAYPLVTHARGLLGHLALGATLATVIEVGWLVTGRNRA